MSGTHRTESTAVPPDEAKQADAGRRTFLSVSSTALMAGGLTAGYGTLGVMAGQFLFPAGDDSRGWQYVCLLEELAMGQSLNYITPTGAKVVVARQSEGSASSDFIALSSTCPHLGCQVHWEAQNDRFFCPCHNGAFDRQGRPTEGPPAAAGQELKRYPLRAEGGMLFIEVPLHSLMDRNQIALTGCEGSNSSVSSLS